MELIAEIYRIGGLDDLIILGALLATTLVLRAHTNRQNADSRRQDAESHAIETNSQLARESQTDLRVQREAYQILRDAHDKQGRELEKAYALLTQSDGELAQCRIYQDTLKQNLQEAQEAILAQNLDNEALRREIIELKKQSQE